MAMNKSMVFAGILTLFQAVGQIIFTGLGLTQYFCIIDFLRELPLLLFIRILYFQNPDTCGTRINIGQSIDGMADQAFVLLTTEPFTVTRTFYVNCASIGLAFFWFITSIFVMMGGARNNISKHVRWPWIIVTIAICGLDIVASVTYANDTFHTKTLTDIMDFIGGTASGTGNINVNTSWASWIMVILYSRFAVLFLLNLFAIVFVIINSHLKDNTVNKTVEVEAPTPVLPPAPVLAPTPVLAPVLESIPDPIQRAEVNYNTTNDIDDTSLRSETVNRIPRPGLSQSFRRMKNFLFKRSSPTGARWVSTPNSLESSPERSPRQHVDPDKKRTVNFPENLLSLPQRLENLIADQQRRLDKAVIDTSGRRSPPSLSHSMPQLASTSNQTDAARGRRGTAAELQGQLPWAYIPASVHRMRDQLPPDEDLPPVPLPDYTAIPSFRKASVHRAASSLSSLTHKRDYMTKQQNLLKHSDVLY